MIRARSLAAALLLFFFLASCGPKAVPASALTSTPASAPTATSIPHAAELRFALLGGVSPVNVWALFDAKGYSYNNYAVMSGYWPRLFQLSIPDRNFKIMAASGMPSPFQQEGSFYTATVPLRTDLKWTDGMPFTAGDVAFTIDTALSFQLGFDWHDFYDPDFIDHAEAVDAHTVKFYFKQQPNVAVWQYGALQGPIVQQAYWSSKVSASAALLPPNGLLPQIISMTAQAADIQSKIGTVSANLAKLSTTSSGYIQGVADIKSLQANLNQTNTALAKAQSQYVSAMDAARQSLYALDHQDEPHLGIWQPENSPNGMIENEANPQFPFGSPSFDRIIYQFYSTEDAALVDLENGKVELLLDQNGLSAPARNELGASSSIFRGPTLRLHFLVFNGANSVLGDLSLHQALACMVDTQTAAGQWGNELDPLLSFVVPDEKFWLDPNVALPCNGLDSSLRLSQAIKILKTAGYTWKVLPSHSGNGQGFTLPGGEAFPAINLIVASSDEQGIIPNRYILQQITLLGVPLTIESINPEDLRYAVFSSHQYDMAILAWNVSEYPGYLCDWFKDGNPFGYHSDRLQSACEALNSTSDLSMAQKDAYEIQSILAQDLPFIPLDSGITYDAYRNIRYPFDSVLGSLSGNYGAPSLAIPAP